MRKRDNRDNWVPVSKATAMLLAYEQQRAAEPNRVTRRGVWRRRDEGQPNRAP